MSLPGSSEEHLEVLRRFLLSTAKRQIDEVGGFHPFGASLGTDGELTMLDGGEGAGETQLAALRADAQSHAVGLLAVGICADVTLEGHGAFPEAIRIELEHRDAAPSTCVVAYRNTDDELTFAEPVSLSGERRTWRE